jgi:hypothetical protein
LVLLFPFSSPLLKRFGKWLEEQKHDVLPKSRVNAAIGSVQNHWQALTRYASSPARNRPSCIARRRDVWTDQLGSEV